VIIVPGRVSIAATDKRGAPGSFLIHLAVSLGTTSWEQEVAEAEYSTSPDSEDL
jgi:hypothetical protein